MKTLIFTQCHLRHDVHGRLMATSLALIERLNPGIDLLLVDNASPLEPLDYAKGQWLDGGPCFDAGPRADLPGGRMVARFSDAIGHFHHDRHRPVAPRDGPGRAIMTALQSAMDSGYERSVYIESDALVFLPIAWGFERMMRPVAFMPRIEPYGYLDCQMWWARDLAWLRAFDFIGKYDWPNQRPDWQGGLAGELQYEMILGEHVESLPVTGGRGDAYNYTAENLPVLFPGGADCLTHVTREAFAWGLKARGHADLVDYLLG